MRNSDTYISGKKHVTGQATEQFQFASLRMCNDEDKVTGEVAELYWQSLKAILNSK